MTKAEITKIGSFDSDGEPIGWEFNCHGQVPAYEFGDTKRIAGWTIEELHALTPNPTK